jgi:23S rRNA (guanosine2251-2'-O)-methyltransferase
MPLPVIVVLDNIRSLYNTGAFFRTADACAVQKLVLCGITPRPDQGGRQARAIAKTALGAEGTVAWEYEQDTRIALANAHRAGYQIAVIEPSADAVSVFDWTPSWPVCVVFGHETEGVGAIVAHKSGVPDVPVVPDVPDVPVVPASHVRIPMLGAKTSLNVATAGGVVLYELLRKHLNLS